MRDIDRNKDMAKDVPDFDPLLDPDYQRVLKEVNDRYSGIKKTKPIPSYLDDAGGSFSNSIGWRP